MLSRIYRFVWLAVHFLFLLSQEILEWVLVVWEQGSQKLWSCWAIGRSPVSDYATIAKHSRLLKKLPKHIAFLVVPEEAHGNHRVGIIQKLRYLRRTSIENQNVGSVTKEHRLDISALTKLVTWAWAANINVISLYDYHGEIKGLKEDLQYSIQDELEYNLWAVKKHRPSQQIPKLRFHNVSISKEGNHLNNNDARDAASGIPIDTMHILLFTSEDGKPGIINVAKDICKDSLQRQRQGGSPGGIKEAELDTHFRYLNRGCGESSIYSDPDVLIISGNVKSTLGFLPWNIRLSEMFWVPKLPLVSSSHFRNVLETYSGCQQRFGT